MLRQSNLLKGKELMSDQTLYLSILSSTYQSHSMSIEFLDL